MSVAVSVGNNYRACDGYIIHSVINPGESFLDGGYGWIDLSNVKEQLEKRAFDKETKNYTDESIASTYPNGVKDFQLDNIPIKAFSISARNVTERLMGDVNLDGKVTVDDATLVQKASIQLVEFSDLQSRLGDVNGDGRLSILDTTCVQKYLAEYENGCGSTGVPLLIEDSKTQTG